MSEATGSENDHEDDDVDRETIDDVTARVKVLTVDKNTMEREIANAKVRTVQLEKELAYEIKKLDNLDKL
eukprot:1765255-Heterocapsa_arctica.AAC.1